MREDEKDCMADIETLINCIQIMLCGKKSRDDKNGAPVSINELEENDAFDGYAFEEEYKKIANREVYRD